MSKLVFENPEDLEHFETIVQNSMMSVWNNLIKPDLLNYKDEVGKQVLEDNEKINKISDWLGMVFFKQFSLSFAGIITIFLLIILLTSFFI